jgi:hypothetical protein
MNMEQKRDIYQEHMQMMAFVGEMGSEEILIMLGNYFCPKNKFENAKNLKKM